MTRTFKILSLLLSYPTSEIADAAPAFDAILEQEGLVPARQRKSLSRLLGELASRDIYDLQERYTLLFDRSRSLSLQLFEHVHGEGRDRGQAMVDLKSLYEEHGLEVSSRELPDFLPLFLEFLSTLPLDEARELLSDTLHIMAALRERLRKRKSPYAAVFWAIEAAAAGKAQASDVADLLAQPEDDPQDLEALDSVWEAEEVTFGPGPGPNAAAACGPDRIAAQIRAGMRSPSQNHSN